MRLITLPEYRQKHNFTPSSFQRKIRSIHLKIRGEAPNGRPLYDEYELDVAFDEYKKDSIDIKENKELGLITIPNFSNKHRIYRPLVRQRIAQAGIQPVKNSYTGVPKYKVSDLEALFCISAAKRPTVKERSGLPTKDGVHVDFDALFKEINYL